MTSADEFRRSRRGFTLVEILVVLVVVGLLTAMVARMGTGMMAAATRSATTNRMTAIEASLQAFALANHRLPCPADGQLAPGDANYGREAKVGTEPAITGCIGNQARGVVPWADLGISDADSVDGYGNRFTYRAGAAFVSSNTLDYTSCDQAAAIGNPAAGTNNGCGPCVSFAAGVPTNCVQVKNALAGKGLQVQDAAGNPIANPASGTGAGYVLISHGENRAGAYGTTGVAQEAVGAVGPKETQNSALNALVGFYVADNVNAADATHFDDTTKYMGALALVLKIDLGPRIHNPPTSP